jgi:hypothetical protein
LGTGGEALTREFDSREGLLEALKVLGTHPWRAIAGLPGRPVKMTLSVQLDVLGTADLLPVEVKGSFTGKTEMSLDLKTGELIQRQETDLSQAAGILLQGRLGKALRAKAESDNASVSASGRLAVESRFQLSPAELSTLQGGDLGLMRWAFALSRARKLGPPRVVGELHASAGGIGVTATRSMPVADLAGGPFAALDFFDPRHATFSVEATRNAQLSATGQAEAGGYRLIGAETEPLFSAPSLTWGQVLAAWREAEKAQARADLGVIKSWF